MKRLTTIFIGVLLVLSTLCCPGAVSAADRLSAPATEENPFYAGKSVQSVSVSGTDDTSAALPEGGYYTEDTRLYRLIKNNLVSRKATFTVPIAVTSRIKNKTQALALVEKLFVAATEDRLAEGCTDGDYLRWAVSSCGYDSMTEEDSEGGVYRYRVVFRFTYYDTAAQEKAVDKAVSQLLGKLRSQQLPDWQRLLAVYRYIADGAQYDSAAAANPSQYPAAFTAYGALCGGKCVCQGYCAAFYRICRALGYRVRIVTSARNKGNHSWNMIELDGAVYFADLTWDDERFDDGAKDGSRYFLVPLSTVQAADSAAGEHILDSAFYNTQDFNRHWRECFAQTAYDRKDVTRITNCAVITQSSPERGVPYVKVIAPDGTRLVQGKDYTVSYEKKGYSGTALTVTGKGHYTGVSSRSYAACYEAARRHGVKH